MATYYSNWYSIEAPTIKMRMKLVTSYTQNKANNTSTVTVKQYIESKDYVEYLPGVPGGSSDNHKLIISGTTYTNSTEHEYTGNDDLIQTRTKTITHNSAGEGSFSISGSCYALVGSDYGYGTEKTISIGTKYITLPTINKASTITSNATSTAGKEFGNEITFTINRVNSNLTHKLTYSSGGTAYTIGEDIGTSKTYTFSTDLITNYPDAIKNGIVVTCTTYNGSTKIGTDKCTAYLSVPSSYVPTCSLVLAEANSIMNTLNWGIYVRSKSQIAGTITAAGSGGSTIKSYLSTINSQVFTTQTFTTGLLTEANEAMPVSSTVTDSRGRTATATQNIAVLEYSTPTISNCYVQRCTSDGTIDETDGTYGKLTIEYNISPVNNGTTDLNTKQLKVTCGSIEKTFTLTNYSGTYTSTDLFSGLETNGSYEFQFQLIDSFEAVPQYFTMPPAFITKSLLAGGQGVTYGQVATEEGFHSYFNSEFHKDLKTKNINTNGLKTEYVQNIYIRYIEEVE